MISSKSLRISLLLLATFCFIGGKACTDDSECADHETCRRLCTFRGECNFVCVTSSVKARILQRRSHDQPPPTSTSAPSTTESSSSSSTTTTEPFTVMSDPFTDESVAEENAVTPQTFSEEDFERELRESGSESTPAPPPSTAEFISTTEEAMPPSLVPEAPGFEEFKSGYTQSPPTTTEDLKYPEDELSEPMQLETESTTSITSLGSTHPWLVTTTFAPALGVEKKEGQIEDSGYGAEVGEVSNSILEEENKTAEILPHKIEPVRVPVSIEAYFGMAPKVPTTTTTGIPTTTYTSSDFSESTADQGVESSMPQLGVIHSTIVEVARSTAEASTVSPTTQSYNTEEQGVEASEGKKAISECPPPTPCEKNCGIYIDEFGCQGCQCLWQSFSCDNDTDCIGEGLFCDEGRCECQQGFVQDMLQSGVCRSEQNGNKVVDEAVHQATTAEGVNYQRRLRRASFKPRRMERLQWPGPCDNDDHCPPNLYCLQGDCWHLPDKPIRVHDPPPKSFPIEDDDKEEQEPASSVRIPPGDEFDFKLFPSPPPSGKTSRSRFVTTTEPNQEELTTSTESTPSTLEPVEVTTTEAPTTTTQPLNTVPFTKLIEVPDISPKTGRRKVQNRTKPRSSSTTVVPEEPEPTEEPPLDPIEFPISSRLQKERIAKKKKLRPTTTTSALPVPRTEFHGPSGVWHDMSGPDEYVPKMSPELPEDARVFLHYTEENRRRKPIRVEMYMAKSMVHDECKRDSDCGRTFLCCEKSWCDLTPECGKAKFCLPHCDMSKMTYLSSMGVGGMPLIDIIYD